MFIPGKASPLKVRRWAMHKENALTEAGVNTAVTESYCHAMPASVVLECWIPNLEKKFYYSEDYARRGVCCDSGNVSKVKSSDDVSRKRITYSTMQKARLRFHWEKRNR